MLASKADELFESFIEEFRNVDLIVENLLDEALTEVVENENTDPREFFSFTEEEFLLGWGSDINQVTIPTPDRQFESEEERDHRVREEYLRGSMEVNVGGRTGRIPYSEYVRTTGDRLKDLPEKRRDAAIARFREIVGAAFQDRLEALYGDRDWFIPREEGDDDEEG